MEYREFWIEEWGERPFSDEINKAYIATKPFEPLPINNKIINVIEKAAFDEAINTLIKLSECKPVGPTYMTTNEMARTARETLRKLGIIE